MLVELILKDAVRETQNGLSVPGHDRLSVFIHSGLISPFLAAADLHDGFLHRAAQGWIFAAFRPENLLLHHGNIHDVHVIVIHILPQRIRHGTVAFVSMHHSREDVLLAADNVYCCMVGILIEPPGKFVPAVVEEVCGVDIQHHLAEVCGVGFQTTRGDRSCLLYLIEHLGIAGSRALEVDIERGTFGNDVLIGIGFVLSFIVTLGVPDVIAAEVSVSCYSIVLSVVTGHGTPFVGVGAHMERGLTALLRKCNNPLWHFHPCGLQSAVGSPRGYGERPLRRPCTNHTGVGSPAWSVTSAHHADSQMLCSKCNKCILSAIPTLTAVLATLGNCKQSLSLIGRADLILLHQG